jgi:ATP-binding cassette subfamily B protein
VSHSTAPQKTQAQSAQQQEKKSLSRLKLLIQFVTPYKAQLLGAITALIFTAAITLSIGQGIKRLIDDGFVAGSMSQLAAAIAVILALTLLMAAGSFTRFYLVSWLGERVSADLRKAVFDHIITLHPSYFETNRSGEIMSRLTTDTTLLQSIIGSSLSLALRSSITLCGALIMLLITNLKLTALVLACVPLVLMPILIFGRRVRQLSRSSQASIADVGSYAGEIIQQIKTVQSYTHEAREQHAFSLEVESAFNIARQRIRERAILNAVIIILVFSALSAMLWVGGSDVISGTMSGGNLGAFVFYALLVATAVATLSEVYGELQRAAGATERLIDLMQVPTAIRGPRHTAAVTTIPSANLRFDRVTFRYPSRPEVTALNDFSLTINSNESLALVGPSGAGKSTVFELLQRFYDPQQGHITLAGHDLRAFEPADVRRQMAVVAQQPALFSADVAHNIRYGKPDASDDEVIAAAKAAHAHDFIMQLPQAYSSHLGEQGVRLSGGQRQRIAIARAILKNPEILLLDEATSALDAESEHQVQRALQALMGNRTTIIIAHRLSTVLHADRIALLDQGKLLAIGDHQSLLSSSPLYHRLASLQFQQYQ